MLGGGQLLDIQVMKRQGLSVREMARRTGRDRKTIRKYLTMHEAPKYKPRPKVPLKLDPYKEYLAGRMAEGVFNATRLLLELRWQGYTGGKTVLKNYLCPLRPPRVPRATVRFETRPGEQAQVDFGVFLYDDGKKTRRLMAFVMVLSWSRTMYVEFVERQDTATLVRCHIHAFEALGGLPGQILYDNMKPVVLEHDADGQPVWNPRFLDFALTAGFEPRLCQPYRPQTKGRVERAVGYLRQAFWPGVRFTSFEDLNGQARAWCDRVANRRLHGTTGLRPVDLLADEGLRAMPRGAVFAPFLWEERLVSRDGFLSYGGSRYGVPWQLAGRAVQVEESGFRLEIWAEGKKVVSHPKAILPGRVVPLAGQWDGLATVTEARRRQAVALLVPAPDVEVRPLAAYEATLS